MLLTTQIKAIIFLKMAELLYTVDRVPAVCSDTDHPLYTLKVKCSHNCCKSQHLPLKVNGIYLYTIPTGCSWDWEDSSFPQSEAFNVSAFWRLVFVVYWLRCAALAHHLRLLWDSIPHFK